MSLVHMQECLWHTIQPEMHGVQAGDGMVTVRPPGTPMSGFCVRYLCAT